MTATDTASHKVSSWNRITYQRLKLALSIGLRRQLFVAVCDDLSLRNRMAAQLHAELDAISTKAPRSAPEFPKLVSLNLNLSDPNPWGQMAQWLAQNRQSRNQTLTPGFQILGVERLTRQPPATQRLFLRHLQAIERHLSLLESALLLWLPRPWFYTIQQSVPEFWQWHTGIFEFEGEPTPLPPVGSAKPETSHTLPVSSEAIGSIPKDLRRLLEQDLVKFEEIIPASGLPDTKLPVTGSEEPLQPDHLQSNNLQPNNLQPNNLQPDNLQPSTPKEESPAQAYLNLGNYYRHAIEQGDVCEENLAIAIQAYEQALQWLDDTSPQVSDILNDIGNLYWMLSRCPTSTEHTLSYLEQAIQSYQLALTKLTAEEAPQTYGMIQNNLGAAYGDLARHKDPAESLEQSIRAYEEALRYRLADSEPTKYASTQNNLGTAHWNLAQHQSPMVHLRAAIASYTEALYYYDTQSEPLNWAMIQNNLGTAYWNLAQYEEPETWLNRATQAYQDALKYRTASVAPAACAATQNNLGTTYWHLADRFSDNPQSQTEYLEKCITAYENAIALAQQLAHNTPPIPVNFDVFATYNNLGLAHYQLATEPQFYLDQISKSAHLEAALDQHIKACNGVIVQSDSYQTALNYIIKTIRAIYSESGITGQNRALSQVPGQLLPEILPRL